MRSCCYCGAADGGAGGAQFTRVYVKTILALLGEAARKGEES